MTGPAIVLQDNAAASANGAQMTSDGASEIAVQLVDEGSWSGTVFFEGQHHESGVWDPVYAIDASDGAIEGNSTAAASGIFWIRAAGVEYIRCRVARTAGAISIYARRHYSI